MSTETESQLPGSEETVRSLGAVMSSEAGFEPELDDSPLRVSGFISVILAVIGGFSIITLPMIFFAIAAVLIGLFALRKSESSAPPVGTTAAKVGIVLAVLLGSWGGSRYAFRIHSLSSQAEHFAREFVKVSAMGNEIYAKELRKSHVNRFLKTMPLEASYEKARLEAEARKAENDGYSSPEAGDQETYQEIVRFPPDHEWFLDRPVHCYYHYGRQMAEVILASDRSEKPFRLRIILEYLINKDDDAAEWYVETIMPYRERIVAETVL
ncbi:MAG: hypothetical protein AAFV88_06685 [Planctomycetota bacterium]